MEKKLEQTKAEIIKCVYECAVNGALECGDKGDTNCLGVLLDVYHSLYTVLLQMCTRVETYHRIDDVAEEGGYFDTKFGRVRFHTFSCHYFYFDDGSLLETKEYYKLDDGDGKPNPFLETSMIMEFGNSYKQTA